MDKISIYVPEEIGAQLDKDAEWFEIYKKDGKTLNRNKFLNLLISGYYNEYVDDMKIATDKILGILGDLNLGKKRNEIAEEILKSVVLPNVPPIKGNNPCKLSLKPVKSSEFLVERILNEVRNDSISQYFCKLFMSYCEKPLYIRERIVFKDTYEKIKKACDENSRIISFKTIWNSRILHEVIPYRVVTGPEGMFNYLLCAEKDSINGVQMAKSYRLNRIDHINYVSSVDSIDFSVMYHLDQMISYGPQYMINDDEETCVRLTESGVRNYNRIYYGRPKVDKIEERDDGYYYYFNCSKEQIFLYFRRFSYGDAEIISPIYLRDRIKEFHFKAYNIYMN